MGMPTAKAAKKLGFSVAELLDAAAGITDDLSEVWPEIDDGYVETIQQLYGRTISCDTEETQVAKPGDECVETAGGADLSESVKAQVRILDKLERARNWGGNTVGWDTLRNHYCQGVNSLEEALAELIDKGIVIVADKGSKRKGPFSLNPGKKGVVEERLRGLRGGVEQGSEMSGG